MKRGIPHVSQLFIHHPPEEIPPPPPLGTDIDERQIQIDRKTPTRGFPTPTRRDSRMRDGDFLVVYGTHTGSHCQLVEGLAGAHAPCCVCSALHLSWYALPLNGEWLQLKTQDRGPE